MKLLIEDPKDELDRYFGFWLIQRIKQYFDSHLDSRKLVKWNKFFDTSEEFINIYGVPIDSEKILRIAISNLILRKLPTSIEIFVNKNVFVPGFDRVKLDTVCRLITFGNQSVSGYSILLDTFQHFVDNIDYYVTLYEEEIN